MDNVLESLDWEPAHLKVSSMGAVVTIAIANPPLNVLTREVKHEIERLFNSLRTAEGVRAVVLTGAGDRAFSAGANIKEFPERIRLQNAFEVSQEGHRLAASIATFPKPTLAAIHGVAFGGGCELALCCDIRVASEDARLGFPEVHRGVFPGNGGTQLLPRLVGQAWARELLLFGEAISAHEAHRIGLVNRVTSPQQLHEVVAALAQELASRPRLAVEYIKQLVGLSFDQQLADGLNREALLFGEVFRTDDVKEGVAAFFEKRQPNYR